MEDKNMEKRILNNIKLNIAISEFGKEYDMKKNTENSKKFSFKKAAIMLLTGGIVIAGGVQAKNVIQSFTNRNPVYIVKSISEAITDGYVENLNMEYIYSNGVGLKINSFFMSDNDINIVFDFKLNDKTKLDEKNLEYSYIVYNENNEVYHVRTGTNRNLAREFIKSNNIKSIDDIEPHFMNGQMTYITKTENNIVISSLMSAKDYFPKAKKLYIKVVGIGYKNKNNNYKALSNSEWNIELDVPDKFYLDNVVEYKLEKSSDKINLESMIVSNTSTTFTATIEGSNNGNIRKNCISIIDENGKEYTSNSMSFNSVNKDKFTCQIPINKKMLTNKMYLKVNINGIENTLELVKKNSKE